MPKNNRILIRGGGDLASGVAARLHRAGFAVLVTELAQPLVVRRLVSFAEAVYSQHIQVEEITGRLVEDSMQVADILVHGEIAVLVDPALACLAEFDPVAIVDARMRKRPSEIGMEAAPLVIGLGPGFTAGKDCHAIVETIRGHTLGRVIWEGRAQADTGIPDTVLGKTAERVLRAPADGVLLSFTQIGALVSEGEVLAEVGSEKVYAPFDGVLRGLVHDGLAVSSGMKIGDVDPRRDPRYALLVSDKALAVGGGVLEALLSREDIRNRIYASD